MSQRKDLRRWSAKLALAVLLALGVWVAPNATAAGESVTWNPAAVRWSAAEFKGSKLLITLNSKVTWRRITATEARPQLIDAPQGNAIEPADAELLYMEFTSRYLGREIISRLWFEDGNGAVLQYDWEELTEGKERVKMHRFTDAGVFWERRNPKDGEAKLPRAQWSDTRRKFVPYGSDAASAPRISEASVLFYIVSAAPLNSVGDKVQVPLFNRDVVRNALVTLEGTEKLTVDYELVSAGKKQRVNKKVEALRLGVTLAEGDDDGLDLGGLKRDVKILIDPETRIPLEARGEVDYAGLVRLPLVHAVVD